MVGLIEQIQRDSLDREISVSDLLRKVKFAAAKLNLEELEAWVDHELKGYVESVPDYRKAKGLAFAEGTDGHKRPLVLEDAGLDWMTTVALGEPIAALEHTVAEKSDKTFYRPYPTKLLEALNRTNRNELVQAGVKFSASAMVRVIDNVRTLILEWAIKMEKAGITGDGLNFTDEEKEKAVAPQTNINIGSIANMVGNLGAGNSMTAGSVVASPISIDRVRSLAMQLDAHANALASEGIDRAELDQLRTKLGDALKPTVPNQGVIAQVLKEIADKLKVAASGVVAQGVISIISSLLGLPGV